MVVFPENMSRLDVSDPAAALATLERYITYMGERIEFSMSNVTKRVSDAGMSSAEMITVVEQLQQDLATTRSALSLLQGAVTLLQTTTAAISAVLGNFESGDPTVKEALGAINSRLGTFAAADPSVKYTLDDHEQRIAALEQL